MLPSFVVEQVIYATNQLRECARVAIAAGDWKVDGAADPSGALDQLDQLLGEME